VFQYVLKVKPEPGDPSGLDVFALWLLAGVLTWNYFAGGTSAAMGTLLGNANLVKKVYFPREVLVFATVGSLLITHFIELGLLVVALLIFGNMVLPWIPVMLVLVVLLTLFTTGIGLVLGALNVYFRDLGHLWAIAIMFWFYASPVVYPLSYVENNASPTVLNLYEANPMMQFVEAARNVMYDLRMPSLGTFAYLTAWAVAVMALGLWTFGKLSGRFAEEL
jgi:ABC-type polysaccharide/polyol phosphate export permease